MEKREGTGWPDRESCPLIYSKKKTYRKGVTSSKTKVGRGIQFINPPNANRKN